MIDDSPEGRRKRRFALPALTWVSALLAVLTILTIVVLAVYLLGGSDIRR